MSIPKLQLVPQPQPQAEVIRHAPDTLDFTRAIIINREQLAEALKDARHISAVLHNIENLDGLDWHEMTELCRTAYNAARALTAMFEAKEVNAQ
ncbi:MAG: hypothetical protein M3R15_12010 [Acidobacteriota bacterium]|nr:hypothetical protein [Acidobacteriota bacterium]